MPCDALGSELLGGELAIDSWLGCDRGLGGTRVGGGGRGWVECAIEVGSSECCAVECGVSSVRALFAGVPLVVDWFLLGACARTVPCECFGVGET